MELHDEQTLCMESLTSPILDPSPERGRKFPSPLEGGVRGGGVWNLFIGICILITCVLVFRLNTLLPLYLDSNTRTNVLSTVEHVTNENGWLKSGVSIVQIQDDAVQLKYRHYHRGADEVECVRVLYSDFSATPCEK